MGRSARPGPRDFSRVGWAGPHKIDGSGGPSLLSGQHGPMFLPFFFTFYKSLVKLLVSGA
jgi:hypothetical protein